MGLFGRKKNDEAAKTAAPVFEPINGPFKVINCGVSVSLDGQNRPLESDGAIRFYDEVVSVYSLSAAGQAKNLFRPVFVPSAPPVETLRYAYSEVSRAYFTRKVSARVDFKDGKYAFFVIMKGDDRERFTALFAEHGVTVEPFTGK